MSGGIIIAKLDRDKFSIFPILVDDVPAIVGPFSNIEKGDFSQRYGLSPIIVRQTYVIAGTAHESFRGFLFPDFLRKDWPNNLWGNIASRLYNDRVNKSHNADEMVNESALRLMHSARSEDENCARFISTSLLAIDQALGRVGLHYNERLCDHLRRTEGRGCRSASTSDVELGTHIHSFFMHVGAVRDYLARLIAHRLGFDATKIDSFSRLIGKTRVNHVSQDSMLTYLADEGLISRAEESTGYKVSGWLDAVSKDRNTLVHNRTYGVEYDERYGQVVPISRDHGVYAFRRQLVLREKTTDVLDNLSDVHRKISKLFVDLAVKSGYDFTPRLITDDNLIHPTPPRTARSR